MIHITTSKSKSKTVFIWILKQLRTASAISGIILILGTAGSSDLNLIPFLEILKKVLVSLSLFGLAWVLEIVRHILQNYSLNWRLY